MKCNYCNEEVHDCECESETSVAAGLGFRIDDEGNWIPLDNEIIW